MKTFTIEIFDKYSGQTKTFLVSCAGGKELAAIRAIVQYCKDTGAYWIPESYEVKITSQ